MDLSLFATSPTDDRHIVVDDIPTGERLFRTRPTFPGAGQHGYPLPRRYTMKPLPPLPPRKLCRRRGSSGRPDFTSRCILTRMKRQRVDDPYYSPGVTLQQRRSGPEATTPQLTLTLPSASREPTNRTASAMIWMPDEQMWLIADEIPQPNNYVSNNYMSAYEENTSYHRRQNYPRSEPSPGPYTYYDLTPPESPVMSQFRSLLVEPRDEERLSPLFQEAVQTVPMSESTSLYSRPHEEEGQFNRLQFEQDLYHPFYNEEERQQSRSSERSRQESFHSAIEFLAEGPTRPQYRDQTGWGGLARKLARPTSAMA